MEAVKDPAIATHLVGFCTRQQVSEGVQVWCGTSGCAVRRLCQVQHTTAAGLNATLMLVPFPTAPQVRDNVAAVLQGLGVEPSPDAEAEAAALAEVQRILEPVQGVTWSSGLPENN